MTFKLGFINGSGAEIGVWMVPLTAETPAHCARLLSATLQPTVGAVGEGGIDMRSAIIVYLGTVRSWTVIMAIILWQKIIL